MTSEKTTPSCGVSGSHVRAAAKQSRVQTGSASAIAARASSVGDVGSVSGTSLAPMLCQYIPDLINGRRYFDSYGADAIWMRALFSIGAMQIYFRGEKPSEAVSLCSDLRGVLRNLHELALDETRIRSFLVRYLETDAAADTLDAAGEGEKLSASVQRIPTMVSKETLRKNPAGAGGHCRVGKLDGVFHRVPGRRVIAEPAPPAH